MNAVSLPKQIDVEDAWPQYVSYRLPRRPLGSARWLGLAPLLAAVLIMAGVVSEIGAFAFDRPRFIPSGFASFLLLMAIPTVVGLRPLRLALSLFFGRREIEVRKGYLISIERIGPLSFRWRWALQAIERLEMRGVPAKKEGRLPSHAVWDTMFVYTKGRKRGTVAWGYPRTLLEPLAHELAERCQAAAELEYSGRADSDTPSTSIAVTTKYAYAGAEDASDDDTSEGAQHDSLWNAASSEPPEGTEIQFDRFDDGVTIKVPPAGIWRGSKGLLTFAILWCGFMTMFDGIILFAFLHPDAVDAPENPWPMVLFSLLFWAVGIAVLLSAIHMGRRQAALAVAGGSLMVLQKGPFGKKHREWPLEHINDIVVGPSGMEVNDRPVLELQIYDLDDEKFGVLSGRDEDELHWMCWLLRDAAGLNKRSETDTTSDHAGSATQSADIDA